jgi:hypothetical protein
MPRVSKFVEFESKGKVILIPVKISLREYKKMIADLASLFYDEYCQHRKKSILNPGQADAPYINKEAS